MKYSYESSEMFLSMVQKEYESEKERAAALDSKISLSLPVISAYFFLLAQDANIRELCAIAWSLEESVETTGIFSTLALYFVAVLTAFCSLLWMIHATWTHQFQELDIAQSYNAKVMSMPKELFSARIAKYYLTKIEQNQEANKITSNEYQLGWIFGIISLICFLLYTVMTQVW
ncbi:MAG: hypothetical protein IJQ25_05015 [Oscillibacter sp.]|nr:hypothetical protein [Oscillibacter sp.]